MGTPTTISSFELDRFCRAVEERDSETQVAMYAPDATVTIADRITQPGSPRVLRGTSEIRGWIEDVDGREMTHAVQHSVSDEHGAASPRRAAIPTSSNAHRRAVRPVRRLPQATHPSSSSRPGRRRTRRNRPRG